MPAIHDFTQFIYFAHQVADLSSVCTSPSSATKFISSSDRDFCIQFVKAISASELLFLRGPYSSEPGYVVLQDTVISQIKLEGHSSDYSLSSSTWMSRNSADESSPRSPRLPLDHNYNATPYMYETVNPYPPQILPPSTTVPTRRHSSATPYAKGLEHQDLHNEPMIHSQSERNNNSVSDFSKLQPFLPVPNWTLQSLNCLQKAIGEISFDMYV